MDDMMNQINLNTEYENELKKAINESMPFVTDLQPLATMEAEYEQSKFKNCFDSLGQRYT